jgi:preprotein translocase subunit SecA
MLHKLIPNFLGNKNQREINRIRPTVARINEIEDALQREPEEHLRQLTRNWQAHLARYHPLDAPPKSRLAAMTPEDLESAARDIGQRFDALRPEFRSLPRIVAATPDGIGQAASAFHDVESQFAAARAKYLDQILPEAYAVVKNAARRLCGATTIVHGQAMTWNMVPFDVQLIGGVALHRGMIAEMQTGEGKTLVATLPVYLNALTGLGVHVVTVNDYLARRDAEWMGLLFRFLGLSVGCITHDLEPDLRREAYHRDITYGTNVEFGFDYLRDNGIAHSVATQVQRGHYFAIIDEVDSILIDEARTPLIITGPSPGQSHPFEKLKGGVEQLVRQQTRLCNSIADEVVKHLESDQLKAAGECLMQLKLGQPRNRRLMRFMEDAGLRRLLEKTELAHQGGGLRNNADRLKDRLFFTVSEKNQDADLMEKGRLFLAPDEPDSFTLADTEALVAAVDHDPTLDAEQRIAARREILGVAATRASLIHAISQLLKAYCLYEKDVHYVVRDGKVVIIDESTGREMAGRRWSDGLHQAVEAKEKVVIEKESITYATITIQNYFRLYGKLAGMTGTAVTDAAEFHDIYQLDVLPIPTHRPNIRIDENDQIFRTRREKYNAVVAKIGQAHGLGQPVLVGTASVEASETLSRMLKRANISHSVLNAKHHEQEAAIIALAGRRGAVTVSTNMAGRGTDIKPGDGVAALGGLFVIGTERHASRRVDRQLRGRCSRQGDPGRSQFFISLEDELLRNHASPEKMASLIEQAGKSRGSSLGSLVETAQTQVEQRDYKARKRVLDFDDVMNLQREIVYAHRNEILATGDTRRMVLDVIDDAVPALAARFLAEREDHAMAVAALLRHLRSLLPLHASEAEVAALGARDLFPFLVTRTREAYEQLAANLPAEIVEPEERRMMLHAVDRHWQEHLAAMDELREGVYLRAQGQKDPLVEFKNEAFGLFATLMDAIKEEAMRNLFRAAAGIDAFLRHQSQPGPARPTLSLPRLAPAAAQGRNEPCGCGSGRKFKQCCGKAG